MISFRQLCQMGLGCPYHGTDECGDEVCSFPYTRDYCPEGDELALINEIGECPLLDYESELYAALSAYQYDRERFNEFVRIQNLRCDREYCHSRYTNEYNERVAVKAYLDYRRLCDAL